MSKEKTTEEIKQEFINTVKSYVHYWDKLPDINTRAKLEGLAFSIMVMIDGGASGLPGFILAPCPYKEDKQFYVDSEEDYYPENDEDSINGDIAGNLHDLLKWEII